VIILSWSISAIFSYVKSFYDMIRQSILFCYALARTFSYRFKARVFRRIAAKRPSWESRTRPFPFLYKRVGPKWVESTILLDYHKENIENLMASSLRRTKYATILASVKSTQRALEVTYDDGSRLYGASASEVLDQGTGMCVERAMVLTALLRKAGIPARLMEGYVSFPTSSNVPLEGPHVWVEAYYYGAWRVLDPTLPLEINIALLHGTSDLYSAYLSYEIVDPDSLVDVWWITPDDELKPYPYIVPSGGE